ncbi:hypothetical protein [Furfurilactobacillus milii]|uniref:Uncharacterized protein n=1 Tax=Furfurilactobacillus milii TaxID=2888272 RepID=A0A6N9I106_9LACO|nr:hypothetical protein [Furfurilactobacillus milii]MYV16063.1 hypothetical protein [Furfurilactobacillus milii]
MAIVDNFEPLTNCLVFESDYVCNVYRVHGIYVVGVIEDPQYNYLAHMQRFGTPTEIIDEWIQKYWTANLWNVNARPAPRRDPLQSLISQAAHERGLPLLTSRLFGNQNE